jgi:hypothetical protein
MHHQEDQDCAAVRNARVLEWIFFASGVTGDGDAESESRTNRAMEKRNPLLGDKDLKL